MIFLYCDIETTGLSAKENSIIQIAGIISKDGNEESFNFKVKPYRGDQMEAIAEEKTGITNEMLSSYPDQKEAFDAFIALLDKFGVGSNYAEKAYFCGYNSSSFDMEFIREWFKFNNRNDFGYRFFFPSIDAMHLAAFYLIGKRPYMKNFQLTSVYHELMGKEMEDAHDALADIKATREIINLLTKIFMEGIKNYNQPKQRQRVIIS